LMFFDDKIYLMERHGSYRSYSHEYTYEGYRKVQILTDPDEGHIHYIYNGECLRSVEYFGGKRIDYFQFEYRSEIDDTYIDIDNIQVKKLYDPFQWLDINRYGGVSTPGNSSDMTMTFSSFGVDPGEYESDMVIRSNDPDIPEIIISVRLNVSTVITVDEKTDIPTEFALLQNYPNPFNPSTVISYRLPTGGNVTLKVYDILGREVAKLVDEYRQAGKYEIEFNAAGHPSGVYIYYIQTGEYVESKKLLLLK
jgi:hypothetical protein